MDLAGEGVQDQSQLLERHDAEKGDISWLAEDHRRGRFAELGERHDAPADATLDVGPVGKGEPLDPLSLQAEVAPDGLRYQRVHRPTVDEEFDLSAARWPGHPAFDLSGPHVEYFGHVLSVVPARAPVQPATGYGSGAPLSSTTLSDQ